MKRPIVIKIGGATFGKHDPILEDIVTLQKKGRILVVVHGGGTVVTDWLKKQNIPSTFVRGERVTDMPTLEMVAAVLGGLVNKQIVGSINNLGGRAVGISGVDGQMIQSRISNEELGFVGSTEKVNTKVLKALIDAGFIPVIAPLSYYSGVRPVGSPTMLNINGDPLAGDIAVALKAEKIVFLTDVKGILDSNGKIITALDKTGAQGLISTGMATAGMIPKINGCLKIAATGGIAYIVDGRQPGALFQAVENGVAGTVIRSGD